MRQLLKYIFSCFSFLVIIQTPIAANTTHDQGLFFLSTETEKAFVAPALKTTVDVDINGLLINTIVRQHFLNPTDEWLEAVYLFPLPDGSSVERLRMKIGNRFVEGKIEEKITAEKIYNEAKKKGKKTSLVSKTKANIFRTNVANIGPSEVVSIEILYQDRVLLKDGEYIFRLPTVLAPRFIEEQQFEKIMFEEMNALREGKPKFLSPIRNPGLPTINPYTLTINLDAGFIVGKVEGLYHDIDVKDISPKRKKVTLTQKNMASIRDFALMWTQKDSDVPQFGLFVQKWNEDLYLFANLFPPTNKESYVQDSMPRDLILVLDKSGSMQGSSMRQLKKSLIELIDMIDETTRINIIAFHDYTDILFTEPKFANAAIKKNARTFVKNLVAENGTRMLPAMHAALDMPETQGRLTQIVALTDGFIGNEEILLAMIEKDLGNKRLFMVGMGSAPNTFIIKEASKMGRGTHLHIGNLQETKKKMVSLFNKLQYPAMLDLKINFEDLDHIEQFPAKMPDLYYGEPFTALMKIPSSGLFDLPQSIVISGTLNGEYWERSIKRKDVKFSKTIHKIFANEKILDIRLRYRQGKITEQTMERKIKEIGMHYQIVTNYTSLVAVDLKISRPDDKNIKSHQLEQNFPEGWVWEENEEVQKIRHVLEANFKMKNLTPELTLEETESPVILAMAQTATPSVFFALFALLLMSISVYCFIVVSRWRRF